MAYSCTLALALLLPSGCATLALAVQTPFGVYWDISHGVSDDYQPTGRYGVLTDHLDPLGFAFTEGTAALDSVDLDKFDVLVLANGSFATSFPTPSEVEAVQSFVQDGGGLLIMSDVSGSSGTAKIQLFADLFEATVGLNRFLPDDVFSTFVGDHPSVEDVGQIYFRFSSSIDPGNLTTYASQGSQAMLAAGEMGNGRVVLIADGDLFTYPPFGNRYFDQADNRQLAESVFTYLAVPEPTSMWIAAWFAGSWMGLWKGRSR